MTFKRFFHIFFSGGSSARKVQKLDLLEFNDRCAMNRLFWEVGQDRT